MAKKMLLVQSKAYFQQYNFKTINLLPVNLYGPGDNFDPESSHVIPALIRKFLFAKYKNKNEVEIWGSGKATREFIYVEDAAEAILKATEVLDIPDPINIGSGMEITIKELAKLIKNKIGFNGKTIWNKNMPDGQPKRNVDTSLAKKLFDFKATTNFEVGIKNTISWYEPMWKKENGFTS
jgi:GDP-L-fucose synthase